jgi:hypothetical protein
MDFLFNNTNSEYANQVFYVSGTWKKPSNITMVQFFLVGAGGGGGNGGLTALGVGNAGGGGGGGGAITKLLIPAIFLPNELYVNVGIGGSGGSPGGTGGVTYVDLINGNNTSSTLIASANGGVGGNAGTGGTAGGGGAGGAAATAGTTVYTGLGLSTSIAGGTGGAGAVGTSNSVAITNSSTTLTSGGNGGCGRNSLNNKGTPGGITGNNVFLPTLLPSGNAVTLKDGTNGINSLSPFQSYGGVGAYGSENTNLILCGGNGGDGILGSGGGGGGGGNTNCVGGSLGGRGGNGFVLITSF